MRKSLGSKRQYVSDADQDDIVRMYGEFQETRKSKIFPAEAFGYRRITVEHPLQLNFQTSEERLERIPDEKAIQKMAAEEQEKILAACRAMDSDEVYRNRTEFQKALKAQLTDHQVYLSAPQSKALLNALSERDPEADICTDKKGNPEADTGLRDYENVPLTESVYDYFEREVKPHVPDAWIDESKRDEKDGEVGIVGFEIPFNRHFYEFTPPRPLDEIDADLKQCTDRIKQMIEELSA